METLADKARAYVAGAWQCLAELLWPTRCAVCERPGILLCDDCRRNLPYIDPATACPRCGAPFGAVQCGECGKQALESRGYRTFPLDGMASALVYGAESARIVKTWKDAGERGLGDVMGEMAARAVPPSWTSRRLIAVPVPASAEALRRRGFDHGADLCDALAGRLGIARADLLERPRAKDQRALTKRGRLRNVRGRFSVKPDARVPVDVLLVDDVCTTGATLFAAAEALRDTGADRVFAVTFARVW